MTIVDIQNSDRGRALVDHLRDRLNGQGFQFDDYGGGNQLEPGIGVQSTYIDPVTPLVVNAEFFAAIPWVVHGRFTDAERTGGMPFENAGTLAFEGVSYFLPTEIEPSETVVDRLELYQMLGVTLAPRMRV